MIQDQVLGLLPPVLFQIAVEPFPGDGVRVETSQGYGVLVLVDLDLAELAEEAVALLVKGIVLLAAPGQQVADAAQIGELMLVLHHAEAVMVLVPVPEVRVEHGGKLQDVPVDGGVIGAHAPVSLGEGVHADGAHVKILFYPVELWILLLQPSQGVLYVLAVDVPEILGVVFSQCEPLQGGGIPFRHHVHHGQAQQEST